MGRDFFDDYGNPETRGKIVERQFARSKLISGAAPTSAGIGSGALTPSIFGRDTPGYFEWHDEFILPIGGGPRRLSPTLAKQLRYRPPAAPVSGDPAIDAVSSEEASLEGMRHE